jgi:hypothetical protein
LEVFPAFLIKPGVDPSNNAASSIPRTSPTVLEDDPRQIEQAGEHQEGNLFDDGQRIGNSAGSEFFPEFIDAQAERAGDHGSGACFRCT